MHNRRHLKRSFGLVPSELHPYRGIQFWIVRPIDFSTVAKQQVGRRLCAFQQLAYISCLMLFFGFDEIAFIVIHLEKRPITTTSVDII